MNAPRPPKLAMSCVRPTNVTVASRNVKLPKLTPEQKRIGDMLLENTGANILDSGGAYGRNWERNQKAGLAGLLKAPEVQIHGESDGSFWFSKSLIHTLPKLVSITKESEKLQKDFDKFSKARPDDSDLTLMKEFTTQVSTPDEDLSEPIIINTYNDSDSYQLSQDLQFALFKMRGKDYVALQIHGGCDARGGYTSPKFFEVDGIEGWRSFLQGLEVDVDDPTTGDGVSGSDIFYEANKKGWKFKNGKIVNSKGKELQVE